MAEVICMPKLGFNMDEGQLVRWCKNVGEEVNKGEVLFEINTDKTTMPVESTGDGVLLKIMLEESEYAEVFTPIAVVGQHGEDADAAILGKGNNNQSSGMPKEMENIESQERNEANNTRENDIRENDQRDASASDLKLTPKAKKLVKEEGIDWKSIENINGSGYQGGITAKDIKASPLAKKIAEKNGVELGGIAGSGIGGKIMKEDVQNAKHAPLSLDLAAAAGEEKKISSVLPYKGIRKIIGDKLAESKFTAPHLYFTESVDTTNMTALRKQMNEISDRKITVSDLLVYAASKALSKYSGINCCLSNENIIIYESTNIGVAVAGDNGLVVPVIKNVQEKSLTRISEENRDFVDRAIKGQLKPEEYSGGTFTISNLGMFGIENFTAIINPPESAILSVSSVRKTPVAALQDGIDTIVIRPIMNIQLSVDHRVIDGLLAARFLSYMKEILEQPLKILM